MKRNSPTVDFAEFDEKCPACGSKNLVASQQSVDFQYGRGAKAVTLKCVVPVMACMVCGFDFTDHRADDEKDRAIRRHLQVMTAGEVRSIRERLHFSRREFGGFTRIGEASLARWESGELIQSGGYDQFLYLLTFQDNVSRLQARTKSHNPDDVKPSVKFKALSNLEHVSSVASQWQLRRLG